MDIKEKAQQYAQNKVQQVLNDAIADAYMEGYRQGLKDSDAHVPAVANDDPDVEFVDLGLPSGTLWAKDYLRKDGEIVYLPYLEAKKYKIPTKEQFDELINSCSRDNCFNSLKEYSGKMFIGRNGNSIQIIKKGYFKGDKKVDNSYVCKFWLQNNESEHTDRITSYLSKESSSTSTSFMGYKLPVLLVK